MMKHLNLKIGNEVKVLEIEGKLYILRQNNENKSNKIIAK